MSPANAILISECDGEAYNLLGMETVAKVTGEQTGGAWCLAEQTVPPGMGVPPHVHTREDEVFFVLEGEVEFLAGGETVVAKAGDIVSAPRGIPHAYQATGDSPARIRYMAMPSDIEGMFSEMAQWPADTPPDPEKLGELCGRFGIRFV